MFAKKVKYFPNKDKIKDISQLLEYISQPEKYNLNEKVLFVRSRGFKNKILKSQHSEMLELVLKAEKSKAPVLHLVINWEENEYPTVNQVDEAIDYFLGHFKLEDHQTIYAKHQDGDNIHLHLAINRVCPNTVKCIELNRGYDIVGIQMALSAIEDLQKWKPHFFHGCKTLKDTHYGTEHIVDPFDIQRTLKPLTVHKRPEKSLLLKKTNS